MFLYIHIYILLFFFLIEIYDQKDYLWSWHRIIINKELFEFSIFAIIKNIGEIFDELN